MKIEFKVTDFNNNNLGVFKSLKKAHYFCTESNKDSWISCPESNYNKTLKSNYSNVLKRISKTNKVFIDSDEKMITISKITTI